MSDAIVIKDLHKTFGEQTVLNGIELHIPEGETFVLLGRSGTGKSVLLKLIVGLQKPDSGSIQVQDREVTSLPVEELNEVRRKIGFLFQDGALYDSLTLGQNVAFPLEASQAPARRNNSTTPVTCWHRSGWKKTSTSSRHKFPAV
jgi:phospholipid/cholesterol/gamma-HCH transport system ATP-binding protein